MESTASENQKSDSQQTRSKEKQKVKKDRMPKVTLQNVVVDDDVVVCMFDTFKGVKITFKFGIHDDEPEDVADKMVILYIINSLVNFTWLCVFCPFHTVRSYHSIPFSSNFSSARP